MNRYCDNYATCNGVILDWGLQQVSDDRVRAAGWRTWKGDSLTGKLLHVTLCHNCVQSHPLRAPLVLEGQEAMFDPTVQSGEVVSEVRGED